MKKPTALNLSGGWEDIVNTKAKAADETRARRITRILRLIVVMLTVIFVNLMLCLMNVIPTVPSLLITGICGVIASFAAGQMFEICNK